MKTLFRRFLQEQEGSSIILVGLAFIGLLAIAGLVIDGGSLYMSKSHLQKTANAAALSGAQELTNDEATVREVVNQVLQAHEETNSLVQTTIEMENKVSVHLKKDVPLSFVKIFGYHTAPVEAIATAEIMTMSKATGAAPLGIDESISLNFYTEYKLKVDETEVDTGNFGVLALGGSGASTYEQNLKYGYQNSIQVGDILETQTGNIAGKTKTGIQERLNACPYLAGETNHRDCSRILLIPVYKPYTYATNQLQEVKITGFAYFYILEPMNNQDKTIKGMFIKRAGTGIVDPAIINKGAYGIRLIE
jgi:hypothetical protein